MLPCGRIYFEQAGNRAGRLHYRALRLHAGIDHAAVPDPIGHASQAEAMTAEDLTALIPQQHVTNENLRRE